MPLSEIAFNDPTALTREISWRGPWCSETWPKMPRWLACTPRSRFLPIDSWMECVWVERATHKGSNCLFWLFTPSDILLLKFLLGLFNMTVTCGKTTNDIIFPTLNTRIIGLCSLPALSGLYPGFWFWPFIPSLWPGPVFELTGFSHFQCECSWRSHRHFTLYALFTRRTFLDSKTGEVWKLKETQHSHTFERRQMGRSQWNASSFWSWLRWWREVERWMCWCEDEGDGWLRRKEQKVQFMSSFVAENHKHILKLKLF